MNATNAAATAATAATASSDHGLGLGLGLGLAGGGVVRSLVDRDPGLGFIELLPLALHIVLWPGT